MATVTVRASANATQPDAQEFVTRAEALAPKLKERADRCEAERMVPAQTIQDFKDAGFFKLLQPKRWGGFAADPKIFFRVQMTVGAACPSSAWVLGVVGIHQWQMAVFPEQAQIDVWGDDAGVLISSSYMPVGKVKHVDGGYDLSGTWGFSSGCDHCDWVFVGGFVPPTDGAKGPPDMRTFLVPRKDYRIVDDWYVSGLKGTGSKTIVIENAFVPEHRTHRFADGFKQKNPGNAVNDDPLYHLPFGQIFVRSVSTTAIGMVQGALDAFVEVQAGRVRRGDGGRVADNAPAQHAVARAAATIDECKLVLDRHIDEMMGFVGCGDKIPLERRVQYRYESSMVVTKCVEAIDLLLTESGGSGIFLTNPINRYFQDVHAARAHYANSPEKPGRNFGSVLLGLDNTDFFI